MGVPAPHKADEKKKLQKFKCSGIWTLTYTGQGSPGSLLAIIPDPLPSYCPVAPARAINPGLRSDQAVMPLRNFGKVIKDLFLA